MPRQPRIPTAWAHQDARPLPWPAARLRIRRRRIKLYPWSPRRHRSRRRRLRRPFRRRHIVQRSVRPQVNRARHQHLNPLRKRKSHHHPRFLATFPTSTTFHPRFPLAPQAASPASAQKTPNSFPILPASVPFQHPFAPQSSPIHPYRWPAHPSTPAKPHPNRIFKTPQLTKLAHDSKTP